jgi:hypothetical protein
MPPRANDGKPIDSSIDRALSAGAKMVRIGHIGIAVVALGSLAYVWACALTGRRDRLLALACVALSAQGAAILLGGGNCPLGPLQQRLGDPTPCFELVLPPRAAKAAFPILVAAGLGGVILVALRNRARSSGFGSLPA